LGATETKFELQEAGSALFTGSDSAMSDESTTKGNTGRGAIGKLKGGVGGGIMEFAPLLLGKSVGRRTIKLRALESAREHH